MLRIADSQLCLILIPQMVDQERSKPLLVQRSIKM